MKTMKSFLSILLLYSLATYGTTDRATQQSTHHYYTADKEIAQEQLEEFITFLAKKIESGESFDIEEAENSLHTIATCIEQIKDQISQEAYDTFAKQLSFAALLLETVKEAQEESAQSGSHTRANNFKYHPNLQVNLLNVENGLYSTGDLQITRRPNERALGVTGISYFNGDVTISGRIITNNQTTDIVDNNLIINGNLTVTGTITGNVDGTATNANSFTGPLQGDVTGFQTSTTVSFVGGQTAAAVAQAAIDVPLATDANVPNTLVKRDGTGAFSGTLNGNATGFSGMLAGDVSGPQGATVVVSVGGQTAAAVAAAVVRYSNATSANVANTLVLRDANGGFASGSHVISNSTGDSLTVSRNINLLNADFTDPENGVIELNGVRYISTLGSVTNTFVGLESGNEPVLGVFPTNCTAIGYRAGTNLLATSDQNTFVGALSGEMTSAGAVGNTAVGYSALRNIEGSFNTAIGSNSMLNATTASANTCLGDRSGFNIIDGSINTCLGADSGLSLTSGSGNTLLGRQSGNNLTSATSITAIGVLAGSSLTTETNHILINNTGLAGDNNTVRIGDSTNTALFLNADNSGATDPGIAINPGGTQTLSIGIVGGGVAGQVYRTVSSRRYKNNIAPLPSSKGDDILALNPVSFTMKGHTSKVYGLIAEEVDLVNKDLVIYNQEGTPESLNYDYLAPLMIVLLKKQRALLIDQQKTIDRLTQEIEQLLT